MEGWKQETPKIERFVSKHLWPELLEAWFALTSLNYHRNAKVSILNHCLALVMHQATDACLLRRWYRAVKLRQLIQTTFGPYNLNPYLLLNKFQIQRHGKNRLRFILSFLFSPFNASAVTGGLVYLRFVYLQTSSL